MFTFRISLTSQAFISLNQFHQIQTKIKDKNTIDFPNHKQWNHQGGWKNTLNNLRLIAQPMFIFWLVYPWLEIFPSTHLFLGFNHLIAAMNQFKDFYSSG